MKIIEISFKEFENFISEEINDIKFSRFPARIIIANDLETWKEVLSVLKVVSDRFIKASEFCKSKDVLPNISEIVAKVKELSTKGEKLTLIPIREIIRVYKDVSLLNLFFFEADPSKNSRLYLPFFGIDKELENFIDSLKDIGIRKAYPIRLLSSEEDYPYKIKFFILKDRDLFDVLRNSTKFEVLEGLCEYMRKLEIPDFKQSELIVFSEILFDTCEKIEKSLLIEKIKSPFDFLLKVLDFRIPIDYLEDEKNYWDSLLKEIIQGNFKDFDDFLRQRFNLLNIDNSIFEKWQNFENFEKWLVFNWAKGRDIVGDSYLFKVIGESSTFNQFEEKIWYYPIDKGVSNEDLFLERIELIKRNFNKPPLGYYEKLRSIKDNRIKMRLLTGIDFYEKREIIQTLAKILESEDLKNDDLRVLQENYPELFYYFDVQLEDNLSFYVQKYIKAKILNSGEKLSELEEISSKIELYSYPSRNSILEKFSCKQVWIDGMGIEWTGLVTNLLRECGYLVDYKIARANLPTTTEYNPFSDGAERFSDLDEIYHKQDRDYPDFLIDEIDTIAKLVNQKIIPLVEKYGEIIITSDHGSTRFSGWPEDRIEIENIEIFRNGRFAKCLNKIPPNSELYYIEQRNDGIYLISKTHRVFKGGKRIKVENHGGATIEESLVPIIHVIKRDLKKGSVKCILLPRDILIIKPYFEVEYYPEVENLEIKLEKIVIRGKKLSENRWFFDLSNYKSMIKPGQHKIKIVSKFGESEEIVNFKSGFTEEDLI